MKGPTKGVWYKLYVILDVYSRYVTGWLVAGAENAVVAQDFLADAIHRNGAAPRAIHADRGGAMLSKQVSELLVELGVHRSQSRPRTSNKVSQRRESHPPLLSEPGVTVSRHRAPTVEPAGLAPCFQ
ncbi:Integrase core domain-containing protein [Parafrankia irregularis]|uniref:Integrase core domain-containing protein n=1 Tax=Parafrankia irregularis TaxID=795642 RepID=A0A0S4QYD1_9ACTN|nr:DDE-type integrase/transposase/recombinase [Parafrankia irregularis]MBE3200340.1 transposase family protein [Parafrankia sp. CH37]CUU59768.1 Integrase core domain-containing protein [Parafrankia irregularis]